MHLEQLESRQLLTAGPILLDFGPPGSPVREDMELVTAADPRFQNSVNEALRDNNWSDWARDFVWNTGQIQFSQPVANGTWRVTYGFGDALTARTQHVTIEGRYIETVVQNKWDWHVHSVELDVTDGSLDLRWASPTYSVLCYLRLDAIAVGGTGEPWFPNAYIPELDTAPIWAAWLPTGPEPSAPANLTTMNVSTSTWGSTELDEGQVHHAAIRADGIELGLGAGSQIYSLRDHDLELIANQRLGVAEWVDEVIQAVVVELDEPAPHFNHQAGAYPAEYSQILEDGWVQSENAYYSHVRATQAQPELLIEAEVDIYQRVRYIGGGFFELTYGIENVGTSFVYDFVNSPWMGLRESNLPIQHLAINGQIQQMDHSWPTGTIYNGPDFDGFMMFGRPVSAGYRGLSLVCGTETDVYLRWGEVQNPARDMAVLTAQRRDLVIGPGDRYWTRFYVGIDTYPALRLRSLTLVGSATAGYTP